MYARSLIARNGRCSVFQQVQNLLTEPLAAGCKFHDQRRYAAPYCCDDWDNCGFSCDMAVASSSSDLSYRHGWSSNPKANPYWRSKLKNGLGPPPWIKTGIRGFTYAFKHIVQLTLSRIRPCIFHI